MILNINKKAYEMLHGKGNAETFYEGSKYALRRLVLTEEELKKFKDINQKSDYKLFIIYKDRIEQITRFHDAGYDVSTSYHLGHSRR